MGYSMLWLQVNRLAEGLYSLLVSLELPKDNALVIPGPGITRVYFDGLIKGLYCFFVALTLLKLP